MSFDKLLWSFTKREHVSYDHPLTIYFFVFFRCINHYIDEDLCDAANGTMYNASFNQEDCTQFKYCVTPVTSATGLLSKPNGTCYPSRSQSVFLWENAEWINSTLAMLSWVNRSMVKANGWNVTIDFPILQAAVNVPDQLSLVESVQNQVIR